MVSIANSSFLVHESASSAAHSLLGQFPGPTVEARAGDTLEIEVTNLADNDEGISIHWHGLSLNGE